jgi:hypothetical protein
VVAGLSAVRFWHEADKTDRSTERPLMTHGGHHAWLIVGKSLGTNSLQPHLIEQMV